MMMLLIIILVFVEDDDDDDDDDDDERCFECTDSGCRLGSRRVWLKNASTYRVDAWRTRRGNVQRNNRGFLEDSRCAQQTSETVFFS